MKKEVENKKITKKELYNKMKKGEISPRRIMQGYPKGTELKDIYKKKVLFYVNLDRKNFVIIAVYENKDNTLYNFLDVPTDHQKKIEELLKKYLQNKKDKVYLKEKSKFKSLDEAIDSKFAFLK